MVSCDVQKKNHNPDIFNYGKLITKELFSKKNQKKCSLAFSGQLPTTSGCSCVKHPDSTRNKKKMYTRQFNNGMVAV